MWNFWSSSISIFFWILIYRYHNDRMINYDTDRGVIVTKDKTGSTMSLKNASSGDSGNYTCVPYNIRAASVLVHVLSEGNSAAQLSNSAVSGQRGRLKRVCLWIRPNRLHLHWNFKLQAGNYAPGVEANITVWCQQTLEQVCWHHPAMFCLITQSRLSRQ